MTAVGLLALYHIRRKLTKIVKMGSPMTSFDAKKDLKPTISIINKTSLKYFQRFSNAYKTVGDCKQDGSRLFTFG